MKKIAIVLILTLTSCSLPNSIKESLDKQAKDLEAQIDIHISATKPYITKRLHDLCINKISENRNNSKKLKITMPFVISKLHLCHFLNNDFRGFTEEKNAYYIFYASEREWDSIFGNKNREIFACRYKVKDKIATFEDYTEGNKIKHDPLCSQMRFDNVEYDYGSLNKYLKYPAQ